MLFTNLRLQIRVLWAIHAIKNEILLLYVNYYDIIVILTGNAYLFLKNIRVPKMSGYELYDKIK